MKKLYTPVAIITALLLNVPLLSQNVGEAAPDFTVDLLGGGSFTLSDHSGKVVMVYFFGNSCPYCISAGPDVDAIFKDNQSNPDFVAVGLDTWNSSSSAESVAGFAASAEITFPLAIKAGAVATSYETTYDRLAVIDQEGVLRHKGSAAAANDIENTRNVIGGLFNATSVNPKRTSGQVVAVHAGPVSGEVIISLFSESGGTARINVYDLAGKKVFQKEYEHQVGEQELTLHLSENPNGIYLFRIDHEARIHTGKFILQH